MKISARDFVVKEASKSGEYICNEMNSINHPSEN